MSEFASNGNAVPAQESRLVHFPVALFSTVMGLAGLALAWMKAHQVAGAPALVFKTLLAASQGRICVPE